MMVKQHMLFTLYSICGIVLKVSLSHQSDSKLGIGLPGAGPFMEVAWESEEGWRVRSWSVKSICAGERQHRQMCSDSKGETQIAQAFLFGLQYGALPMARPVIGNMAFGHDFLLQFLHLISL
ncbi:hypothetical protein ROHU_006453 [Labeo rohita]|uniref:Uncharacterized protein n=1 Tax=Labeo rohita TaxID=84645 RepID=A0A498MY21_LABRO|nr:hypothetical protein ROHU_006453 [Labeo rohita]